MKMLNTALVFIALLFVFAVLQGFVGWMFGSFWMATIPGGLAGLTLGRWAKDIVERGQ